MHNPLICSFLSSAAITLVALGSAAEPKNATRPTLAEVEAAMQPYSGTSLAGVDRSTLTGKVMTGYQGWFTTPGDASGQGWRHYSKQGKFIPGQCSVDLWPDLTDYTPEEKHATEFRHADGRIAEVFSSHNRATVLRHFQWMQEYGIDGAFVQRFVVETRDPISQRHCNAVLANAREGANTHGRTYAVMYDLSGLPAGGTERLIADWKRLVDKFKLGRDAADRAYLRHNGRPVVSVWGVGFNDHRPYTLAECDKLVDFLKDDPTYGGNTVLLGVPTGWRTLNRDALADKALHEVAKKADILSPWTVGRYHDLASADKHADRDWSADIAWCREHQVDYLPVVFPGFSWHNMRPESQSNAIPRLKGEFLWRQLAAARRVGASMIYVAMFDELDEGTAVFKCTNNPPVGASKFLDCEGLPSDHYLWLSGLGGKLLRKELPVTENAPQRAQDLK